MAVSLSCVLADLVNAPGQDSHVFAESRPEIFADLVLAETSSVCPVICTSASVAQQEKIDIFPAELH